MANFLIYHLISTIEVSEYSEFKGISVYTWIFTILIQKTGLLAVRDCLEAKNGQLSYLSSDFNNWGVRMLRIQRLIILYLNFYNFNSRNWSLGH